MAVSKKPKKERLSFVSLCVFLALVACFACQGFVIYRLCRRRDDGLTDVQMLQVARIVSRLAPPSSPAVPPPSDSRPVVSTNFVDHVSDVPFDAGSATNDAAVVCPWPVGVAVGGVNGVLWAYDVDAPLSWRCKVGQVSFWDGSMVRLILPRIIETELARYERNFGKELKGKCHGD